MKDSGVEWIGEIPENWQRTALLNNLRTFITDGPHETVFFVCGPVRSRNRYFWIELIQTILP